MAIVVDIGAAKTLGDMKTRIADEIARSDLTSQIGLAIEEAIDEASANRFWFNEVRGYVFSTVATTEYYTSDDIAALIEIDSLWLLINGQRRNLCLRSNTELDGLASGETFGGYLLDANGNPIFDTGGNPITDSIGTGITTLGEPDSWARYGDEIRFYPVPRQAYTVYIDGTTKFPPLTEDTLSNPWMVQGERYVRAIAKRMLFTDVIRDFDEASAQEQLVEKYLGQLVSQTYDRVATGRIRAWA